MADDEFREQILRAFGVTQIEVDALDPDGTYELARRRAAERREHCVATALDYSVELDPGLLVAMRTGEWTVNVEDLGASVDRAVRRTREALRVCP